MEYKLYDSELKLLEILWDSGELPPRPPMRWAGARPPPTLC